MHRLPFSVLGLTLLALSPLALRNRVLREDPPVRTGPRNVAIVLYPGVELLDFAGPGEVFAGARTEKGPAFHTYTVARSKAPLQSMRFVTVTPQYTFEDCPKPDIVVVPGGDVPTEDQTLRAWVSARSKDTELMMSVCNGALIYAAAGLLKGLEVTTHHSALQGVALLEPEARVYSNRRFVDNGHVLTAAGIAAGIDGALHVVERFCGQETAWNTARGMEYDWRPDEIARLHAQPGTPVEGLEGLHWVSSIRKLGVEGALSEYKQLPQPPTEAKITGWGYAMLREGRTPEAIDVFRLLTLAFPESPNAMDSLSEALEAKPDAEGAKKAAHDALARLEANKELPEARRSLIRNAAASRIARLTGGGSAQLRFVCPPCERSCDKVGYLEGGRCPNCSMELVERTN
jgi:putative intracellular protease/amidase